MTEHIIEDVHLTLPRHIFSVQVKSGACYITGQWEQDQNKIKEIQPYPLTFYYLLLFFIIKYDSLS